MKTATVAASATPSYAMPLSTSSYCIYFISLQMYKELQHTHTHPFNGPFSGTTRVGRYQKGKPIWILLKQEIVSGSSIICKSAPRS